jgi:hypothetical protein
MKAANLNLERMRKERFTLCDRKISYRNLQKWIDDHNKANEDFPEKKIRAGRDRTLNYLAKCYLDQVDAGLAGEGFFETAIALIATTIHMDTRTASRHLAKLQELGFITSYNFAKAANNTGHASNYKVQMPFHWVAFLPEPQKATIPHSTPLVVHSTPLIAKQNTSQKNTVQFVQNGNKKRLTTDGEAIQIGKIFEITSTRAGPE